MPRNDQLIRARKIKAYNLFIQGKTYQEIADELGVSKPLIGRWAKQAGWQNRAVKLTETTHDLLDAALGDEIAKAINYMRSKIADRMAELELACKKGSVTAILAWLNRAGVPVKGEGPETTPSVINLREDLRADGAPATAKEITNGAS